MDAQAEYLRKKKEEILAKKKAHAAATSNSTPPKSVPFANDGSFLEKFKAMQGSQKVKKEPIDEPNIPIKGQGNRLKSKTKMQPLRETAKIFKEETVDSTSSSSEMNFELARELAEKVHKEGVQAEMMARIQGRTNPRYQFLFNESSPVAKYYQAQLKNLKNENESVNGSKMIETQPSTSASTSSSSSDPGKPGNFMSDFEKAKALVQAKAAAMMKGGPAAAANVISEEEKKRQKAIEEQKMMNEIYMKVIHQQMAAASEATRKRKRKQDTDKPKYEYDSDEDTEGGTWEHKKRLTEMQKTAEKALELTESARGLHHISDFLPPDELEKFLEKVQAVKEGREVDFSDYAKYKIGEDNIGYQMLQKAGWQEGSGLGSKGEGITAPINKGKTSFDQGGIGTEKVSEVKKEDDDFEVYRKRMMLAYKFRPNPLNNPRRPYYE